MPCSFILKDYDIERTNKQTDMESCFLEANLLSGVPSPPYPQNLILLPLSTQPQKLQWGQWCDANSWKSSEEAGRLLPKNISKGEEEINNLLLEPEE